MNYCAVSAIDTNGGVATLRYENCSLHRSMKRRTWVQIISIPVDVLFAFVFNAIIALTLFWVVLVTLDMF
jgi:hypothetical protein